MSSSTHPFISGKLYRVKKQMEQADFRVREGQLLRYLTRGYGPYDEVAYFNFLDENDTRLYWELFDTESIDCWSEIFEEVNEESNQPVETTDAVARPPRLTLALRTSDKTKVE